MKRTAIFVDAGYLYAQGSACLQGTKAKRENLRLDHAKFVKVLRALSQVVQPAGELLRIYWYDGTSRGPTQDHRTLAEMDDVKLRLGFINSVGQQKGVDSLLVTDLVELSRNGAIGDAVLLGGDEDLRIGVQIAQSFGVRVHLVGIEPARGSQSQQLRQEADTQREIPKTQIGDFLTLIVPPSPPPPVVTSAQDLSSIPLPLAPAPAFTKTDFEQKIDQGIATLLDPLDKAEILSIKHSLTGTLSVPAIYDRRLLASCRTALGRDLIGDEKKAMRVRFIARVKELSA